MYGLIVIIALVQQHLLVVRFRAQREHDYIAGRNDSNHCTTFCERSVVCMRPQVPDLPVGSDWWYQAGRNPDPVQIHLWGYVHRKQRCHG